MDTNGYTNWLEVDLGAARNNIKQVQQITGRPVMAVIKANAYGHGSVEFGRAAVEAGSTWLGVARIDEALLLRQAGISARILVLGYTPPARVAEAAAQGITLAITAPELAEAYSTLAEQTGHKLVVHAKIDTGMGRLGVLPSEGVAFIQHLRACSGLDVEGIFTHFARADEPALPTTHEQLAHFNEVLSGLDAAGMRPKLVHAANSAAAIYFPESRFDMVRAGIIMYGLDPSAEAPCPPGFTRVATWKTRLASVKDLPAGHGIGYAHRYVTPRPQRVGALTTGYADGMRRILNVNHCIVRGQKLPMIGGICMDQCMIPLDTVPDAQVGDEVVLIGQQGDQTITAEEIGKAWGTVNYEVICALTARVSRLYFR